MTSPTRATTRVETGDGGRLRIVCISTDVHASAALQAAVALILPAARVETADTSIVRGTPDAECVILAVGSLYSAGPVLARELRARGYAGAMILVCESTRGVPREALAQLGVAAVLGQRSLATDLPSALERVLLLDAGAKRSQHAADMVAALRRLQMLLAAGELAGSLQHKLNNPLAALLAEAQLLELEALPAEHAHSVRRIVELCRRVIDVTRSIEGVSGGATAVGDDGNA